MAAFAAAAPSAHYSPLLRLSSPMHPMPLSFPAAMACGLPTNLKPPSFLCCCSSRGGGESAANAKPLMGRERAAKVAMPILAAAIVGWTGISAHAEEWRSILMPVSNVEVDAGQDSYQLLLEKIKEGRQRNLSLQVGESSSYVEKEDPSVALNSRVQKLKEAAEVARRERENAAAQKTYFGQTDKEMKPKASPVAPEKSANLQADLSGPSTVVKSEKKKTHGFLPLFVSQFLLLLATVGGGATIFLLPDSYWKELQKMLDDNLEKASPLVEEAYKQLQPLAIQTREKAQELGIQAKPYVLQALKASTPVALKAFEASKPVLKVAQSKAVDLFQQAQEKAKSLNQQ